MLPALPTKGGVQVEDGFPSCLLGIGGGQPSEASALPGNVSIPEFCTSASLDKEAISPDAWIFVGIFEGLVAVTGVLLADELVIMLIPGCD